MRKTMTKEVTKTTIKSVEVVIVDGLPTTKPLEDIVVIGNVSKEKAQKVANKHFEKQVTVFGVEVETVVYEMEVEEFIKHARIKQEVNGAETPEE